MLTDNDIAKLVGRIVDRYAPLAVCAFGSYATGAAHDRSDLDLAVLIDPVSRTIPRGHEIKRAGFGLATALDVHVFSPAAFEDESRERLSFAWVIARQARILHHTPEARRLVPSLFVDYAASQ